MSSQYNEIEDFGPKLTHAADWAKGTHGVNNSVLQDNVGTSHDTWAVWKRGERSISKKDQQEVRRVFFEITQLDPTAWDLPVAEFAKKLGREEAGNVGSELSLAPPVIEFKSRDKDPSLLLEQLSGVWVAYYCSTSRDDEVIVSRDLIQISDSHSSGYISCRVVDGSFDYSGFCFSYAGGLLQWVLEKESLYNEVLTYMTTRPERTPPVLVGVMLCTSGGVSTVSQLPAAAKVAMVRLGSSGDIAGELNLPIEEASELLHRIVPTYVDLEALAEWIQVAISNEIGVGQAPFALITKPSVGQADGDNAIANIYRELKEST